MNRPVRILVVEDNPADVLLVQEALYDGQLKYEVQVAEDGAAALSYLRCEGEFQGAFTPDLVLLDLNLPKVDGRTVLKTIKSDPNLHQIPVIILSTSSDEIDVSQAYGLHANCYLTKSVEFDSFWKTIRGVEDFWLGLARLPTTLSEL